MATEEQLRTVALGLPEVTERPSHGRLAFRVRDKPFAVVRSPGVLVIWCVDEAEKEGLIAADPQTFFTIPHFDGYAAVLVRLPVVGAAELRELVTDSWRLRAPRRLVAAFDADAATGG